MNKQIKLNKMFVLVYFIDEKYANN